MKSSFNSNVPPLSCALFLLLWLSFPKVYGQEGTSYPLIKADSTKLCIGNYSIDFTSSTFKDIDGTTSFVYDSIVSKHDFDLAITSGIMLCLILGKNVF